MATIAELNVVIGARVAELQKSLKTAERDLRRSGTQFSRIGTEISTGLSIPLGLAGVAAIRAAGDIESLTLALKSQLGSSAAATKELELLTEAAKKPGLGVEQAVRGSVRLQGVGFAAEEARKVLIQMGNAIAATGGSAQELDNVTRQFAQMTSKGRVLQEDVSILSENMPGLAQLMQKAFGTQSVEAIRAMGVSGKDFVLQITKAAEALPRVEGGIKNSIGNALDSLKQSAAKVGLAINEAFDVTGTIELVSRSILSVAQSFSALDPSVQKTIIGFSGMLIAIGPLIKAKGALQLASSQLVGAFGSIVGSGKILIGATDSMAGALTRVKVALGIVGLIAGLAFAVYQLSDNFDAATFASEQYSKAQGDIISETSKEIGEVNKLFAAVKDETKSKFEKGQSIDKLLKLYPDYFKGMDLEGASVSRLTELQNGLNSSILRGVAERKKAEAVNTLYEKQAAILTRITQIREGGAVTPGEASLINTGDMIRAGGIAEAVMQKMGIQAQELTKQIGVVEGQFDRTFGTIGTVMDPAIAKTYEARDAYQAEKEAHEQGLIVTKNDTKERKLNQDQINEQVKRLKNLREVLSDISNAPAAATLIGDDADIAKLEALRKGIVKLIDAGFSPLSKEVQGLKSQLDELTRDPKDIEINIIRPKSEISPVASTEPTAQAGGILPDAKNGVTRLNESQKAVEKYAESIAYAESIQTQLNDKTFNFSTQLSDVSAKMLEQGNLMAAVFTGMADAISSAASQGTSSFKELGLAAAGAAAKIVRAYIQQGVAAAVAKALSTVPFPFNIAAGAAAGGLAAALFTNLIGKIGVKGFASGTRDAPGGLALVGERGPELVNLPRHSQVFTAGQTYGALRGSGQTVQLDGHFVLKGTDLVLLAERVNQKNLRSK